MVKATPKKEEFHTLRRLTRHSVVADDSSNRNGITSTPKRRRKADVINKAPASIQKKASKKGSNPASKNAKVSKQTTTKSAKKPSAARTKLTKKISTATSGKAASVPIRKSSRTRKSTAKAAENVKGTTKPEVENVVRKSSKTQASNKKFTTPRKPSILSKNTKKAVADLKSDLKEEEKAELTKQPATHNKNGRKRIAASSKTEKASKRVRMHEFAKPNINIDAPSIPFRKQTTFARAAVALMRQPSLAKVKCRPDPQFYTWLEKTEKVKSTDCTVEVYKDYDVILTRTKIEELVNNYRVHQILVVQISKKEGDDHANANESVTSVDPKYYKWTRYGQIGSEKYRGAKSEQHLKLNTMIEHFHREYEEFTGYDWDDPEKYDQKDGKWATVMEADDNDEIDEKKDGEKESRKVETENEEGASASHQMEVDEIETELGYQKIVKSRLKPEVQNFIRRIFDAKEATQNWYGNTGPNVQNREPMGKLNRRAIAKAFTILDKIKDIIKVATGDKTLKTVLDYNQINANRPELLKLTNQFYSIIPYDFGTLSRGRRRRGGRQPMNWRIEPITFVKEIDDKADDLAARAQLQLIRSAMLEAEENAKLVNPLDAQYDWLDCDIELLESKSALYKTLEEAYRNNGTPPNQTGPNWLLKIKNIWKLTKPSAAAAATHTKQQETPVVGTSSKEETVQQEEEAKLTKQDTLIVRSKTEDQNVPIPLPSKSFVQNKKMDRSSSSSSPAIRRGKTEIVHPSKSSEVNQVNQEIKELKRDKSAPGALNPLTGDGERMMTKQDQQKLGHYSLLWHGTKANVIAAILKEGIQKRNENYPIFTSNSSLKSVGYMSYHNSHGYLLLAQIDMELMMSLKFGDSWRSAYPNINVVWARGAEIPDPKDDISLKLDDKTWATLHAGKLVADKEFYPDQFDERGNKIQTYASAYSEILIHQNDCMNLRFLFELGLDRYAS